MSLLDQFLNTIGSYNTRRAYRADLCDFFGIKKSGDLEPDRVDSVSRVDVREYLRLLRTDGNSISTRRRRLSALRRFFDWTVEEGCLEANPARDPRIDTSVHSGEADASAQTPSVLSKSEVESLVQATHEAGEAAARDRGLLLTILYAALRRTEVAAMDVEHVRPLGRHWVVDLPSGSTRSSAYVKIPEAVVEAIDSVQARYGIKQGALWRSLSNRNRGARMTPDAIYKVVRRTGRRVGLDRVTVDMVRRTGLRLAMDAGSTMRQVQAHARLKSAQSVERYRQPDEHTSRLSEGAPDFIELDIQGLPQ
jgi:site-specific recombinase XerD